MKSYLKGIIIFNSNGVKRVVPLKQGVNIITGDSKTGKSALVEIIDYCLCSSRCTIPKGKITEFARLYCLLLVISDICYVIARRKWEDDGKMYFVRETLSIKEDDLTLKYFVDKPKLNCKDVQKEIEASLGLEVSNMKTDEDERNSKKASLRNMVTYLFQHQNLMASKFALFYRFSDFYKRKDVIDQFPVFAGIIGQEYYSDLISLNKLKSELKKKKKSQVDNKVVNDRIKSNLVPLMKDYFSQLNQLFDDQQTLQQMLRIAKKLPNFNDSELFQEDGLVERYHQLNEDLEKLRSYERDVLLNIQNLKNASSTGTSFVDMLKELRNKTNVSEPQTDHYNCPLCGNKCEELLETNRQIAEASDWLENEIQMASKYTSSFSEDIRKLEEDKNKAIDEIKKTWTKIKDIEKKFLKSDELVSKREKLNYAKARIMLYAETMDEGLFKNVDQDILELEDQVRLLEQKLDGFDVTTKIIKAQNFLSTNMNKLAQGLDFEDEYRPVDLNFGLIDGTFDLYQHQRKGNQKIFLYEMGSGANWVSCHIALFLSFLRYFASQENSPMPMIMFFDQPSQVYFPQGLQGDESNKNVSVNDIQAVNKMYKTIFNEINAIGSDTGILPQIIIVDHVSGTELEVKDEFLSYWRKDWRNGEGLI